LRTPCGLVYEEFYFKITLVKVILCKKSIFKRLSEKGGIILFLHIELIKRKQCEPLCFSVS
jgi:hypothetical protein